MLQSRFGHGLRHRISTRMSDRQAPAYVPVNAKKPIELNYSVRFGYRGL